MVGEGAPRHPPLRARLADALAETAQVVRVVRQRFLCIIVRDHGVICIIPGAPFALNVAAAARIARSRHP